MNVLLSLELNSLELTSFELHLFAARGRGRHYNQAKMPAL
jgi:hypothetical protein